MSDNLEPFALDVWRKDAENLVEEEIITFLDEREQARRVLALLDLVAKARGLLGQLASTTCYLNGTHNQPTDVLFPMIDDVAKWEVSRDAFVAATASLKESERG